MPDEIESLTSNSRDIFPEFLREKVENGEIRGTVDDKQQRQGMIQ